MSLSRKNKEALWQAPSRCEGVCCAGCHHYQIGEDFEAMKIICWLDDHRFSKKAVRQCLMGAEAGQS